MATINEKISKDIKYIGKDFPTIRKNLVEFAKTYYPTTLTARAYLKSGLLLSPVPTAGIV